MIETTQDRTTFIGGSDVAALCGVSPWKTAVELYMEKVGQVPEKPVDNMAAELGRRFERPILELALERLGIEAAEVEAPDEGISDFLDQLQVEAAEVGKVFAVYNVRMRHPRLRFVAAEADVLLLHPTGERWIIDAKRTGFLGDWRGDGDQLRAPRYYEAQFRVQMSVYNAHRHYAAVLPSQSWMGFHVVETRRDPDIESDIMGDCKAFWQDHVLPGHPPEPNTYADAFLVWPRSGKDLPRANPEATSLVSQLALAREAKKQAAADEKEIQTALAKLIGDSEGLSDETGAALVTWKAQESTRIDSKALRERFPDIAQECSKTTKSRVMRLGKAAKNASVGGEW